MFDLMTNENLEDLLLELEEVFDNVAMSPDEARRNRGLYSLVLSVIEYREAVHLLTDQQHGMRKYS